MIWYRRAKHRDDWHEVSFSQVETAAFIYSAGVQHEQAQLARGCVTTPESVYQRADVFTQPPLMEPR